MIDKVIGLLMIEEGLRLRPYLCSEGYPTIGVGTKIGPKGADINLYNFSITKEIAGLMLKQGIDFVVRQLGNSLPFFNELSIDRQVILISMGYQLGVTGLLKFKNMIAALKCSDYDRTAAEMIDSKWYRQTTKRAKDHATVMRTGKLSSVTRYAGV